MQAGKEPTTTTTTNEKTPVTSTTGTSSSSTPVQLSGGYDAQTSYLEPGGGLERSRQPLVGAPVQLTEADSAEAVSEGEGDAEVAAEVVTHDPYAPSPEAAAKFAELKESADSEIVAEFIMNELLAMGVTPRQIDEYILHQTGSGWDELGQLLAKGKYVRYDEDGTETFRFAVEPRGLSFSSPYATVGFGKTSQGSGVWVHFDADGNEVSIEAGSSSLGADGGFGDVGTKVVVKGEGGETTTGELDVVRTAGNDAADTEDGYSGTATVTHDTGDGTTVTATGTGGVDGQGNASGGGVVSGTSDGQSGHVGVNSSEMSDGHIDTKVNAGYSDEDVSVDVNGQGGADTTAVGAGTTFNAGDVLQLQFKGSWRENDNEAAPSESGGGSIGVSEQGGGTSGGGSYNYGESTDAETGKTLTIHTVVVQGQEIALAELDGLSATMGFKGTIEIIEGDGVEWTAAADFKIVEGTSSITFKTELGEQTLTDLNSRSRIDLTGGGNRDGDATFVEVSAGYTDEEFKAATSGLAVISDESMLFGIDGSVSVGNPAELQHKASFAYEAEKSDEWTHYAAATYAVITQNYSVSATGSVEIKKGDAGWDEIWSLHVQYGFSVGEDHRFVIQMGVGSDGGDTFAWDTSVQWDWAGLLNVKITGSYSTDGNHESYGGGFEVKPGGEQSPVTIYGGVYNDGGAAPPIGLGEEYSGDYGSIGITIETN